MPFVNAESVTVITELGDRGHSLTAPATSGESKGRDDAGEFLHAYTDTFDDRFFFEIVQRCGQYEQFGAANAAVRMASQAQRLATSRLSGLLA